jgi:glycyl-tRNA synthetase beta chain
MPELLLELLSEEIPARMQTRAAEDLQRLVSEKLAAAGLTFTSARALATPRRLALVVDGLPERQPDRSEERKGPRVGSPEQAIQGFLKSAGLTSLDQCEKRVIGKAEFYFATSHAKGAATAQVLPALLIEALRSLPWPKSMRWGALVQRWVRPLHSVLAVFDGAKLAGALELGEGQSLPFGATTRGHRFLAPAAITVRDFPDYQAKLRAAKVVLDAAERRSIIARDAEALAKKHGLKLKADPGLIDEVAGLVEWPVALMGRIDAAYLASRRKC